jgi:hypothetical protein
VLVERGSSASLPVSGDAINETPCAVEARGALFFARKHGAAVHRMITAPLEVPMMNATAVRVSSFAVPVGRFGVEWCTQRPAARDARYLFTEGDDVILIAAKYGGAPAPWLVLATTGSPIRNCEPRTEVAERNRLFAIAGDLYFSATASTYSGPTASGRSVTAADTAAQDDPYPVSSSGRAAYLTPPT